MRLSEAIRLGSMLRPQAFGDFSDGVGTCAMGAAHEAAGRSFDEAEYPPELSHWDDILDGTWCPACGLYNPGRENLNVVAHLNDVHRWTRERIASWVETQEPALEKPPSVGAVDPAAASRPTGPRA